MITFRKEVFEVFDEYKKAGTREERLDVLKKYEDNWAFKDILRGSFDESLEFNLPAGRPPFTPNKAESAPSSLLKQHKEFGLVRQGWPRLTNLAYIQKRESIRPASRIRSSGGC